MRTTIAILAVATAATGCPSPPPAITSIDGLQGGALATDLSVPALAADAVTTDAITTDELQSNAVTATTIDATTSLTTPSVEADRVSTTKLVVRGMPVFGAPVGTVDYTGFNDGRPGYRNADALCRADFGEEAHVCGADEVMAAYRAGIDPPASMHQAAVNTFSSYTTLRDFTGQGDGFDVYYTVNDCDAWRETVTASTRFIPTTEAVDNAYPITHTYLALDYDQDRDVWRLKPPLLIANCSRVKLACCG
jgi:hypothetical protein